MGSTYNLSKSINDYRYIIVYAICNMTDYPNIYTTSTVIDKSKYQIGVSTDLDRHCVGSFALPTAYYWIAFNFPTDKQIKITTMTQKQWSGQSIYLIKGVK